MPRRRAPHQSDATDPGCVKTHTSAKCRKNNSPTRHRTPRVQYDLTLRDAIDQRRYFYVRRERWSFRTAKTHLRHHEAALRDFFHTRPQAVARVRVAELTWNLEPAGSLVMD